MVRVLAPWVRVREGYFEKENRIPLTILSTLVKIKRVHVNERKMHLKHIIQTKVHQDELQYNKYESNSNSYC